MVTETQPAVRREPRPLNGVDTPTLLATINTVKGAPALAAFQFRARNRWLEGTHSLGSGGSRPRAFSSSTRTVAARRRFT
jgi:hypothetical protein